MLEICLLPYFFLGGGLYSGGLIFGGNFVLVSVGNLYSGFYGSSIISMTNFLTSVEDCIRHAL